MVSSVVKADCKTVHVDGLRVAVIAPPYYTIPPRGYGGIERVCHLLVEGLVTRGHQVTLIAAGPRLTSADFVATFPEPQPEAGPDALNIEIVHAARAAAAVADLRPDIVHDHTQIGVLTAAHRRPVTIVTCHNAVTGPDSFPDPARALGRRLRLVSVSAAQRRDAPDLNWIGTVHNGVNVDDFPFRSSKDDFLLYLGRISPHKGVHLAIETARAARRRLVIAGSWTTPAEREYFDSLTQHSLRGDVEWVGEVHGADRAALLGSAAALLFPAQWGEPFGLAMIEAMACGTPVIALGHGAAHEIVTNGETGFVCSEPGQLVPAVNRIDQIDPRCCRARVERRFPAALMVSRYQSLYHAQLGQVGE
jgi:glycosyltransferase involved in cell wall biosynthesis